MTAFSFQSRKHALAMAIVSLSMCLICAASIGVAEALMPDNMHGQQGVITFYRWFGLGFAAWFGTGVWAFITYRSMCKPVA